MFVVCGEALMDVFGGADSAHGLLLDARIGGAVAATSRRPIAAVA